MKFRNFFSVISSIFLAAFILQGCAAINKGIGGKLSGLDQKADELELSPDFEKNSPITVAILPFENVTDKKEAIEIVRRSFYNHFASKKYHDVELHKVDTILMETGLYEDQKYLKLSPEKLGNLMGADSIVYGKITEFSRVFLGVYSNIYVQLEAKLINTSTGEVLWRAKHRTVNHEGGVSFNPLSIISTIIRTSVNIRDIEFLRVTDDLCRVMVATVPDNDKGIIMNSPEMALYALNSTNNEAHTGKTDFESITEEPVVEIRIIEEKSITSENLAPEITNNIKSNTYPDTTEISNLMRQTQVYMQHGKNKDAKEILEKVVSIQPDNHNAHFLLGMLNYNTDNYDQAMKYMEKAIALEPENAGYHYNLGLACFEKGNLSDAAKEWKKVIELDTENKSVKMLLELYVDENINSNVLEQSL